MARSPAALAPTAAPPPTGNLAPPPDVSTVQPVDIRAEFDPYFDEAPPIDPKDRGDFLDDAPDEPAPTPEPAPPVDDVVEVPTTEDVVETPPTDEPSTPSIPKPRFDEVNEQRKRLARENEELKRQLAAQQQAPVPQEPAAPAYDFAAKEKEYMEAVLDGNTERALAIRNEIRTAERAEIEAQLLAKAPQVQDTVTATREALDIEAATRDINERYPVFDPESSQYNQELTDEAIALVRGYMDFQGMSYPAAANKVADMMAKLHGFASADAPPAAPAAPAKPTPAQVKSKVEAAAAQPPASRAPVPVDPDVSVNDLSQEEFEKLPHAVKARLRGDFL